jgi:hypothetical protein
VDNYSDPTIIEAWEIERTVEIHLASNRIFRLEILRAENGIKKPHYSVRYYERHTLYKAPDGTISTESIQFNVWVRDDNMPGVNMPSAEAALSQALEFLVERRNNQNIFW